ncbi:MAG: hypothetical protein M1820_002892 [Bogoriella megaspora]|nr:MAG: hypothetical protein M1820_002892 [Bogoriella megaspora]
MSTFGSLRPAQRAPTHDSASSGATGFGSGNNGGSGSSLPDEDPSKRKRRAPNQVTQNACTNCKKARSKASSLYCAPIYYLALPAFITSPDPLTNMSGSAMGKIHQCHYEVHVKTIKEDMVRRIKNLEQRNADLEDSMRERTHWIQSLLQELHNDEAGQETLRRLRDGQTYEQITHWLGRPPIPDIDNLSPQTEFQLSSVVRKYEAAMPDYSNPFDNINQLAQWTKVTNDSKLVHHLMLLYFAWFHPIHMVFSEKHFVQGVSNEDEVHCSAALVNAICALGCFVLQDHGGDDKDAIALAGRFLSAAQEEIKTEDRSKITYSSSYALIFLVELSLGQARRASSHLRLAVESLNRVDKTICSQEAFEVAYWGIHTLNTAWAGFTYQKPPAPISTSATPFIGVQLDNPNAKWIPYRMIGDQAKMGEDGIPVNAIRTALELAKLNQIIHETINVYCGSRGRATGTAIMTLYRRFIDWESELPMELRPNDDPLQHSLPHAIFLNINYHVAICQLFQPLITYDGMSASTRKEIELISSHYANRGLNLLRRFREQYQNRYQTPLQAFHLIHLCEAAIQVSQLNEEAQRIASFCLEMLSDALPGFPFVGPLQAMFCQTVTDLGLLLPDNAVELMGGRSDYGPEEMLDACERTTFVQPVHMLVERLDPAISEDFQTAWFKLVEEHGSTGGDESPTSRPLSIHSLVNP